MFKFFSNDVLSYPLLPHQIPSTHKNGETICVQFYLHKSIPLSHRFGLDSMLWYLECIMYIVHQSFYVNNRANGNRYCLSLFNFMGLCTSISNIRIHWLKSVKFLHFLMVLHFNWNDLYMNGETMGNVAFVSACDDLSITFNLLHNATGKSGLISCGIS